MKSPDMSTLAKTGLFDKAIPDISTETFEVIQRALKNLKNFNLDIYKDKCIKRRIAIRIRATHSNTAEEYCNLLHQNEGELDCLLKVLTIHVSQFYRNPPTFEKLHSEIFPYLFTRCNREGRDGLKLWSVGCSSGEEPYTVALILKDFFADEMTQHQVTILATDVDAGILDVAQKGIYVEERLVGAPQQIKTRWFSMQGGKYHLAPEIKEMVTFRQSDLFDIDSFPESDLILCRNVLIYFERWQQEKIISRFADILGKGGILILGKSETLFGENRRRFQTVCPVERIYKVM
ncbi:MAG: chemotaxis protein methyltransferase [Geobacteraceae bacterium]|nr:MAG: chemotaxis protein methyltransferase [Geobacteraceae bacterium]